MPTPTPLKGIFTPNIVPLDAAGQIHEPELRRYTEWLIERGVHGLYPNGSTGEFTRFTPQERRRIIAIMADQARGRVPILAGAAEANVRETIAACEYYHGLGVRAVAIVSPFYYKLSPANVYAYFKEIADHSPIIPLAMRGQTINPLQNSLQHGGRGQTPLRSDGSSSCNPNGTVLRTQSFDHKLRNVAGIELDGLTNWWQRSTCKYVRGFVAVGPA